MHCPRTRWRLAEAPSEGSYPVACAIGAALFIFAASVRHHKVQEPPAIMDLPISELRHAIPELHKLKPAEDQASLPALLEKVGAKVAAFFQVFPNTTADETIHEERFGANGAVPEENTENFRYFAVSPTEHSPGGMMEYRADGHGHPVSPKGLGGGFMLTEGFVAAPIIFDPAHRNECRFRYLGTEKWRRHRTEVVAFAQRPQKALLTEKVVTGKASAEVLVQGIAWIDPASNEIVAMLTDLLHPYLQVSLERQTTRIDFAPLKFKELQTPLWLPRRVVVTARLTGGMFRNIHSYSNYRLFSVKMTEKPVRPGTE